MDNFTLDADGASVKRQDVRKDGNNTVVRTEFNNGFVWIYTNTPTGFTKIDFNRNLQKQVNGTYKPLMDEPKADFHDYF